MTNEAGFLETNGARIYYEVDGRGEPLVLIHAGVADLRMWDDQAATFRDRYRVIRYDTRGFGRTETEAVEFSNRADIAALLDHLGEDSAHVVGFSRAGSIAIDFALEFPDRVCSLVVGAGGIRGYESPAEAPPEAFADAEAMEAARDWNGLAVWEADYWASGPGQPRDRVPAVWARVHGWVLENYRAEKVEGQPRVLEPPAAERLAELSIPLMALVGTLDDPGTQETMHHLAREVPGARLEVWEGVAHMINLEQPERFNRVLADFLSGVPDR